MSEDMMKGQRSHPEGEGERKKGTSESSGVDYNRGQRPPQPPPYSLAHQMRALGLGINSNGPALQGEKYQLSIAKLILFLCSSLSNNFLWSTSGPRHFYGVCLVSPNSEERLLNKGLNF